MPAQPKMFAVQKLPHQDTLEYQFKIPGLLKVCGLTGRTKNSGFAGRAVALVVSLLVRSVLYIYIYIYMRLIYIYIFLKRSLANGIQRRVL
jgi:hypothetical protein